MGHDLKAGIKYYYQFIVLYHEKCNLSEKKTGIEIKIFLINCILFNKQPDTFNKYKLNKQNKNH